MSALSVFQVKKDDGLSAPKKRMEQNRGDCEDWDSSRDGSAGEQSPRMTGKRKSCSDREPESPGDIDQNQPPYAKKEKSYLREKMETDSPSSYPRHVIVPSNDNRSRESHVVPYSESTPSRKIPQCLPTPTLTPESAQMNGGGMHYDSQYYRPSYYPPEPYHNGMYHNPGYPPEMEMGYYGSNQRDVYMRPRRWACDYCNVATFLSYEEACAHEAECSRRHHDQHYGRVNQRPPLRPYVGPGGSGGGGQGGNGLGALYHASQEVGPMPHGRGMWNGGGGPPIPLLPDKGYRMHPHHGYGDYRNYEMEEHHMNHHQSHMPEPRKRMLLSLPTDTDSLSDRQCYVRTSMVEIFAATDKDVSARHTKGAQKLVAGQVGIRCVHCAHLRTRDRAERAVCYPSSISRIYQTVADMQRFHFEQCQEIPDDIRKMYKSLKTTRPRGVGSPQTYWIQSAKLLGLTDTEEGIRFEADLKQQSDMSV